jgi:NUMOD3 motif/GIY-YIG catalytic domain
MEKNFNFVYVTTNLINGKEYIGDHSTNNLERDNYLGSGKYLQHALNEYGRENFARKILEKFNTKQEAFDAQEKYIKERNTLIPNGYNLSPTGGHQVRNSWSEESIEKVRKAKIGNTNFKGKHHTEESKLKSKYSHLGKNCSDETKEKMRNSKLGKTSNMKGKHLSEESKEKISIYMQSCVGEKNHFYGKNHSEESKQKMRKPHKSFTMSEETKEKMRKPKSEETKQKMKAAWIKRKKKNENNP